MTIDKTSSIGSDRLNKKNAPDMQSLMPDPEQDTMVFRDIIRQVMSLSPHAATSISLVAFSHGHGVTTILKKMMGAMDTASGFEEQILFVDSHGGESSLSRRYGLTSVHGLSDAIHRAVPAASAIHKISSRVNLLPCGSSQTFDSFFSFERYAELLSTLKQYFRLIFIDTPPLCIPVSLPIIQSCDLTFLVLASGHIHAKSAEYSMQKLRRLNCKIEGAILNRQHRAVPSLLY